MKITVWGINYAPEVTGIAPCNQALCEFLQGRGHVVRMVTAFAYYPAWRKNPADRGCWYRTDDVRGVLVHRCWQYAPRRPTAARRILHEASFVLSSWLRLVTLPVPDVYVVVSPPLLLGAAAWVLGVLKGAPFVFHVQDLQPDSAFGLGMLKRGWWARALYALETLAYRKAARVGGISPGMTAAIRQKGVAEAKLVYFPNGVELPESSSLPARGRFRQCHGFSATDFLAVYAGNLGVKQGLEILLEAARVVRDPRIHLVLCGEGAHRERLQTRLVALRLANVRLFPLQPEPGYRELLADADLCVITQQAGSGAVCFPSKLLRALAQGKPVLAVADPASELVRAQTNGAFGVSVPPGDPGAVARALEALASDPARLRACGAAGRRYVERFELRTVSARFAATLEQLVAGEGGKRIRTARANRGGWAGSG